MNIIAYLYDAGGNGEEITLGSDTIENLSDDQLLWVNILERKAEPINHVAGMLGLHHVPVKSLLKTAQRPRISRLENYYHIFIISVEGGESGKVRPIPIDYLCGKNFVVTIHDGDVRYLQDFTHCEEGQTMIGELDTESFVATLLDLHVASYFRVMETLERQVDRMDEKILSRELEDEAFLEEMVALRKDVSRLRRWLLPHRDVFYALSRPDFRKMDDSDSLENFQLLNNHFESAVDSIETSRDTVLSLFDLYTTKTSHRMNNMMRRLTFITVLVGGMGVVAGTLGMNFKEDFFDSSIGFWVAISIMLLIVGLLMLIGWRKRWL